jgi:hypothetical protein
VNNIVSSPAITPVTTVANNLVNTVANVTGISSVTGAGTGANATDPLGGILGKVKDITTKGNKGL